MKEIKLLIAGGRDFNDHELLANTVIKLAETIPDDIDIAIVSGMANGADKLGYLFAKYNQLKCYEFPANWDKHGKRAGFIRNEEMGKFTDMALIFWDGQSRGTKHMLEYMHQLNKPVHLVMY